MSDPREQQEEDLPFERSSIAAMGARRSRGLLGRFFSGSSNGAEAPEPETGFESGPLHPGMLEGLARQAGADAPETGDARPGRGASGFESGPLHAGMLQGLALEAGGEAAEDEDARPDPGAAGFESGPLHAGMLQGLALEAGDRTVEIPREEAGR